MYFWGIKLETTKDKEDLRKEMLLAQKEQKMLLGKRDLILSSRPEDQNEALLITHKIAKLLDFIKSAEEILKKSD